MGHLSDQREMLVALTESLVKAGTPSQWAELVAYGMLAKLERHCWTMHSDQLGTHQDLSDALSQDLPNNVVSDMLYKSGMVGKNGSGIHWMMSAVTDAPEWVRKAWIRNNREGFEAARERAGRKGPEKASVIDDIRVDPEDPDDLTDLFGEPLVSEPDPIEIKKSGMKSGSAVAGFAEVRDYWFSAYKGKYGRTYAFRAKDGRHIKLALGTVKGDAVKLCRSMDNYLACKDAFYVGHELDHWISKLNRWIAPNAARSARENPSSIKIRRLD